MDNMRTTINLPPIIFGTSGLGNLYVDMDEESKCEIIKEYVRLSNGPVVFDSAGKYGAGLALEVIGNCLRRLNVPAEDVIISNKLGWLRTELKTAEPTFEPGVWKNLKHDAVQKISYEGIMECFAQGNELLGGYLAQMLSVHDPDEYLASAKNEQQEKKLYQDILDGYKALYDLKKEGKAHAIGVGAKDWKIVKRIANDVPLDWIMIANSMTIKTHPQELLDFIVQMENKGVYVINSAVFHSGFLVGSDYFDYKLIQRGTTKNDSLFNWRDSFFEVCRQFNVKPATACVQFALNVPGVKSIALNTTEAGRVKENLDMISVEIPAEFWTSLQAQGLIAVNFLNDLQPLTENKISKTYIEKP